MSTSWTGPDPRPVVRTAPAFGQPPAADRPAEPPAPPVQHDVQAGLITLAVTLLVGAPVGLLWAAFAPRVVVNVAGDQVSLADTYGDGFIAVDGYFLAAVAVAGLVGGLLAHRLASRHGPVVVVALAVGGLAAAYTAMVVGEQVGLDAVRSAIGAGQQGRFELSVDLRSTQALAAWPAASLITYLAAALSAGRRAAVSSG